MTRPHLPDDQRPVIFAYDGTPAARRAMEDAIRILPPGPAVVATVWRRQEAAAPAAVLAVPAGVAARAVHDLDAKAYEQAEASAAEGAELLRDAGFDARATSVPAVGSAAPPILGLAADLDARAIVVGARGRSALTAALLGSVSAGVLRHSTCPVVVVR